MREHLLLVDATGFAHRAYHASAPNYRESDGLPTWAILGFMAMLWRLQSDARRDRPTHGAAVFDPGGRTYRHKIYAEYKAGRNKSEELDVQFPYMRHAAKALGLKPVEAKGYEADDVIATLAHRAKRRGMRTTIVSSDKDFCQLVEDNVVEIVDPLQRRRLLEKDVVAKFGVDPSRVPDVQALAGDSVDNIPGVKNVGLKRAGDLIRRFGNLDKLIRAVKADRLQGVQPSVQIALQGNEKDIKTYRKLALLRKNITVNIAWPELLVHAPHLSHVKEMLRLLEASSRFEALFGTDPKFRRPIDEDKRPLDWWRKELKSPGQNIPETPQCGFYMRRLGVGFPFVGARIYRERELDFMTEKPTGRDILMCEVGGKARDPVSEWGRLCTHPIPEARYRKLIAAAHDPSRPEATPSKKINFNTLQAPLFDKRKRRRR